MKQTKNFNIANILSSLRVILLPILYIFAFLSMRVEFLISYILIGATDALDGFLARALHQVTQLGKILDTVADILFYFSTLFFIYYFYPDIVLGNIVMLVIFLCFYLGAYILSFIKFGKPLQIHTHLLRLNALFVYLLMIISFFFDTTYVVTFILCTFILGFMEEIAIFIFYDDFDTDTRSIFSLMKKRKKQRSEDI